MFVRLVAKVNFLHVNQETGKLDEDTITSPRIPARKYLPVQADIVGTNAVKAGPRRNKC